MLSGVSVMTAPRLVKALRNVSAIRYVTARRFVRARLGPLSVVLALALLATAGCGGKTNSAGSDSVTESTTNVVNAPPPSTEGTGPEPPQPGGNGGVAISLPSVPIGGGHDVSDDGLRQCAHAEWKGPDIPSGVSVSVESISIKSGGLTESASSCEGGNPSCDGFDFTQQHLGPCDVGVAANGQSSDGQPLLLLTGSVQCPSGDGSCIAFGTAVKNAPAQGIGLDEPPPPSSTPPSDSTQPTSVSPSTSGG